MLFFDIVKLALDAARETKRLITSSHDIIPKSELPMLSLAMMAKFQAEYGDRAIEHLNCTLSKIRPTVRLDDLSRLKENKVMVPSLALGRLGRGECEEHAYVAAHELLKRGYYDFHICIITGKMPTDGTPGSELLPRQSFSHAVIIMNTSGKLKGITLFRDLEMLPTNVVILDAYLKHVGSANQYSKDMHAYLRHYSVTGLSIHRAFSPKDVENVAHIEKLVSAHLKRFDFKPYVPSIPVDKEVNVIVNPIKIFDLAYSNSFAKSFSSRLRALRSECSELSEEPLLFATGCRFFKPIPVLDVDEPPKMDWLSGLIADKEMPEYCPPIR
jgi:hypothetical protein